MTPAHPQSPRPHSSSDRYERDESDSHHPEHPPVDPSNFRSADASDGSGPWLYAPDGTGPWILSTHGSGTFTLEQPKRTTWASRLLGGSLPPSMRRQRVVGLVSTFVGLVVIGAAAGFAVGMILNEYGSR